LSDCWNFAIDEEALKEIRAYREFLAKENKVKQMLENATPGTEYYKRCKLSWEIFQLLREMRWANHEASEKVRLIRWVDEK
jgi:hypothetical protein